MQRGGSPAACMVVHAQCYLLKDSYKAVYMVTGMQWNKSTRRGVFFLKCEKEGWIGGWLKQCLLLSSLFYWSHWTPFPSALFFFYSRMYKSSHSCILFTSVLTLPAHKQTHTHTHSEMDWNSLGGPLHHQLTSSSCSYIHTHYFSLLPSSSHPLSFPEHLFFSFLYFSFRLLGLAKCTVSSFFFQLPLLHIFHSWSLCLNFSNLYSRSHSAAKTWQSRAIYSAYNAYLSHWNICID